LLSQLVAVGARVLHPTIRDRFSGRGVPIGLRRLAGGHRLIPNRGSKYTMPDGVLYRRYG